eukprot:7379328-Prymnesium_polylepis.5
MVDDTPVTKMVPCADCELDARQPVISEFSKRNELEISANAAAPRAEPPYAEDALLAVPA